MANIEIREELLESIRKVADQEARSVEGLVNDWLTRQLALIREQKIREESARFRAQYSDLRQHYADEYVAMQNGVVLDHDQDARELYLRIKEQYGNDAVLIAPVTEQPIAVFEMRSPRLVSSDV